MDSHPAARHCGLVTDYSYKSCIYEVTMVLTRIELGKVYMDIDTFRLWDWPANQ